jgi:putative ABC transport system substrate-binding protein
MSRARVSRRRFVRYGAAFASFGLLAGCSRLGSGWPGTRKVWRIGFLATSSASSGRNLDAFRAKLRDLGYVEGDNAVIEARWTEGIVARYGDLASELVKLPVDVLVTALGNPGARAAKQATTTIPIVMAMSSDPVGDGLIADLSRPGGNLTGLTTNTAGFDAKRLQIFTDAIPSLRSVVAIWDPANSPLAVQTELRDAAAALNLDLTLLPVSQPSDFASAFERAAAMGAGGIQIVPAAVFGNIANAPLVDLATRYRLPSMSGFADFARQGGLLGYSPDITDLHRRAAIYVDKILRGTKPADLPVEQAERFDLVVNARTAQALGLSIAQSVLGQATEVVQ